MHWKSFHLSEILPGIESPFEVGNADALLLEMQLYGFADGTSPGAINDRIRLAQNHVLPLGDFGRIKLHGPRDEHRISIEISLFSEIEQSDAFP